MLPKERRTRKLEAAAIRAAVRAVQAVPEAARPPLQRLGVAIARLVVNPAWVGRHFRTAFGEDLHGPELKALNREFYEHLFLLFWEVARLPRWSREQLLQAVDLEAEGEAEIRAALASGKSVIVISGHLGNWEVGAAAMAASGLPVSVVTRPLGNPAMEDVVREMRSAHGVEQIGEDQPVKCVAALRKARLLVICIDRRPREGASVVVPFFGQNTACYPGPAHLALRHDGPIVFAAVQRRPDGRFRLKIAPLEVERTGDTARDAEAYSACFQLAVEEAIRECPAQWIWHRPRWRLRKQDREIVKERKRQRQLSRTALPPQS